MMKSSMKLGNRVESRRNKHRLDKISNLPDELLVIILSFLPTWYGVRTSILSRRWRYLFTLTDCLYFDDEPFKHRGPIMRIEMVDSRRFENFVYKVLELHKISPIRKFSLVCRAIYSYVHLNAWVKHAIQKEVQEIHYHYDIYEGELPYDLITCKTLVKLSVIGYKHHGIKIPKSSWLPNLKILHLNSVRFGDDYRSTKSDYHSTERLLSSCEFLEELTLDNCVLSTKGHVTISLGQLKVLKIKQCSVENGFFEIEAPKLAYLTYYSTVGVKIVPLWKYSCSLVKTELHLYSSADDRDILRDVAYKTTELHFVADYIREGLYHRCLFSKPPQNESLLPFSCNAKVIEVNDFCGYDGSSLLLLGHLLRNARVLKKLIVRKCHGFDDMEKARQLSKDLLMLPRASSDCSMLVLNYNGVTSS
ncbi:F-box/LRR-repeat protein At3g59190-like [Silene latifolia]|uniref:F-box/LRR-repeat protein At3g59190-like n=1 Tax=Silene latifolia TaxID=37657 RepID=UPI003D789386